MLAAVPRRLVRTGVVLALVVAPVLPGVLAAPAGAQTQPASAESTLRLTNPDGPTDDLGLPTGGAAGELLTATMTPDPTKGVAAGDTVTIEFTGLQPYYRLSVINMCPTELESGQPITEAQCNAAWPTGIQAPLDTTGQTAALSTTTPSFPLFAREDGTLTVEFRIGEGKPNSPGVLLGPGKYESPTCGLENACTIGFQVTVNDTGRKVWTDLDSARITPAPPTLAGAAGCGSPTADSLAVGGSERAQTEATTFNSGKCAGSGAPLPMDVVAQGEPDGLRALGDTADMTFAGSGLLSSSAAPSAAEPRVLTPVGLNAVVLAQVGGVEVPSNTRGDLGQQIPSGSPDPLGPINLTQADVADIVVHDFPVTPAPTDPGAPAPDLFTSIVGHPGNERLAAAFDARGYSLPFGQAPTTVYPVGADSTPVLLSDQLNHDPAAKAQLVVPDLPSNVVDETAGTPVPPFTDFSAVTNSSGAYVRQTSTVGGLYTSIFGKDTLNPDALSCPQIDPTATPLFFRNTCAKFIVTDLVTATSLDLEVASVQNASGEFAAPTVAGLQAAADQGATDEDGVFRPNLDAQGAAYPMTFVEYAVSQASPLLDESCAPRTAAQNSLNEVATYLANGGQSALADGLAPLTAPLVEQARASVARIGASSTTSGPCAPVRAADILAASGGASSASGLGGGSGAFAAAGGASALSNPAGLSGPVDAAAVQVPTAETTAAVEQAAATVDIPVFGQAGALGALGPLAGLVGLVGLTSGAGVLASNRLSGKSFADLRSWVHHTFVGDPEIQTVEQR